jgi:hypoxanthine-DNA glycosylase
VTFEKIDAFPPFYTKDSTLLILGSFPSVKSRETSFFYGNDKNRFWHILYEFFNENAKTVEEKKALLIKHNIAIWDMITQCEIKGSMDSNIRNYKVSDLNIILSAAPIKKIFVNGQKAKQIFAKHYPHLMDKAVFLPSTSPANTRLDKTVWLKALKDFYNK